jgi:hypothetical protein
MIRILFVTTNSAIALYAIVAMLTWAQDHSFRNDREGLSLGLVIIALALANATYIWLAQREPRPRSEQWRIFRLVSLWLDAKEADLRQRAKQPPAN